MPKISKVQAPRPASSRPGNVKQPREEANQFICTRCGKIYRRQKDNFSASYSPLYRGNGGYLPVCKHCIDDLYDHYKEVLESEEKAIRRICMKFDIYWNRKVFDMVWRGNTSASRMRNYMSRCNLNAYVNKTYDDTLDEEAAVGEAETVLTQDMIDEAVAATRAEMQAEFDAAMKAAQETVQLTADGDVERGTIEKEELPLPGPEIVKFWGSGLSADYYYALQERFDKWTANQPKPLEPATEALYKQVCICEEQVHRGLISGQSIERPQSMLNTLLGSLNEKPTQKKQEEALDADFEKMTFGQGIKAFENLRPVPKPDPEFEDVDGIRRYISTWFFGHLCSMLNIKNSYCRLYEEEMARLRVERPDLAEMDDDSVIAADIFGEEVI